jgi:hypothetical protein
MADIRTVKIAFKDLEFLQDNPRKISRQDLERLAGEIKRDPEFFNSRPCLVNYQDGRYLVYAGFQRAHAANTVLKWKEIPCSVENDVPTDVMRRRAILDNTHAGQWDSDVLANWEFEPEELSEMWVSPHVWGGDGENGGGVPNNALNSAKAEEDDFSESVDVHDYIFPSNNQYDIPTLNIEMVASSVTSPVILWGADSRLTQKPKCTVLFYVDDYRFEAIWKNPISVLRCNPFAIVEPNFSLYDTTPISFGLHQIYKKRWISRYLQEFGVKVFADLNVSKKFKEYNKMGIPKGWNAFATRGYSKLTDCLEDELNLAREISDMNNPLMIVYGGGEKIKDFSIKNNLVYIDQFRAFDKH